MTQSEIDELGTMLDLARRLAKPVDQISTRMQGFSRADAYAIQEQGIRLRVASGERFAGYKMGLTSEAKRKQMNLDSPLYGVLTDKMQIADGGTISLHGSIHPKIEPEIAFYIGRDLQGVVSADEAMAAVSGVCCALEILDSRYTHFKYFSMEDVIADNSSSFLYVMGPTQKSAGELDLANLKMEMSVNGAVAQRGSSSAISGNPILSLVELCALLSQRGLMVKAPAIVLTGAATAAVELDPGMQISLTVEQLGETRVSVST